ncbi:hypothetical protein M422DRAFT_81480, partial [Sphaerobolus stellatus SS14]
LGFYIPSKLLGFAFDIPTNALTLNILFYEALTVASTVAWATELSPPPCHVLVYTDSLDSIKMFHSLHTHEGYNELLLFVAGLLLDKQISLRFCHVSGVYIPVASTLSRTLFDPTCQLVPGI